MNISSSMSGVMMSQMQGMNQQQQQRTLSEEQQTKVQEILAEYDADNISQQDFEDISQQFKEAGIRPSESLKTTVEAEGFDFSTHLEEAQQNGSRPPPPPPQGNSAEGETEESEYSQQLAALLEAFEEGDAEQSDFEALIESIKASSTTSTGNILSRVA